MAAGLAFMAVCSTMALGQPSQPVTPPPATPVPAAPAPAVPIEAKPAPAKDAEPAKAELTYATIETSMGNIVIELDGKNAPISMANFWSYANKGHYEGTLFHRVIPGFMIQGGGHAEDMTLKPTDAQIKNEWRNGLKNVRGTVSMARLGGNADSASSQFFINTVDNPGLDRPQPDGAAYAVFGKVVAGMDVVDAIRNVKTGVKSGMRDVPLENVVIKKARKATDEEIAKGKAAAPGTPAAPAAPKPTIIAPTEAPKAPTEPKK